MVRVRVCRVRVRVTVRVRVRVGVRVGVNGVRVPVRVACNPNETTNVIRRDAKVSRATRAQITSFMRSPLIIFADPFIVILTWNMVKRLSLGFSRNLHLE